MSAKHPGFKAVQRKIESEGYSAKSAGAILASSSRNASKAAHAANPRLAKVHGSPVNEAHAMSIAKKLHAK
jgi:uncharacterized iron-regulated membrane protein